MPLTSKHLIPIGLIAFHFLMCLLLLPQFKYCLEADFYSYLSIAEKYVNGDFYHAINPYWSPFFSWLMIPMVWLDLPVLLTFKWIFVVFGAGIIWQFHKLLLAQAVPPVIRFAGTAATTIFCIYFSVYYSMPDIMVVYFYLLYFSWHKGLFDHRKTAVITGLIAGFCFFVKAYSLPFFLLYSVLLIGSKWLIDKNLKHAEIKNFGVYLLTMLVVASCWMLPLSIKNGGLTMGSSGSFNYHMKMSDPYTKQLGYPYEDQLLPPPNPTAISYWEDPSTATDQLKKQSKANLGVQIFITVQNIFILGKSINYYNPLFFMLFIVVVIGILRAILNQAVVFKEEVITAALFIGVYPSGYLLLFINERYQWVIYIFVLYISTLVFAHLVKKLALEHWQVWITSIGFFCITAYAPTDRMQVTYRRLAPAQKEDMRKALEIKDIIPAGAKIATDKFWGKGLVTAFVNDNQFYGVFKENQTSDELISDIQRYQIEYVLLYTEDVKNNLGAQLELVSPPQFTPAIYKVN